MVPVALAQSSVVQQVAELCKQTGKYHRRLVAPSDLELSTNVAKDKDNQQLQQVEQEPPEDAAEVRKRAWWPSATRAAWELTASEQASGQAVDPVAAYKQIQKSAMHSQPVSVVTVVPLERPGQAWERKPEPPESSMKGTGSRPSIPRRSPVAAAVVCICSLNWFQCRNRRQKTTFDAFRVGRVRGY